MKRYKIVFCCVFLIYFSVESAKANNCIAGDCNNGKGYFIYTNGDRYLGDFKDPLIKPTFFDMGNLLIDYPFFNCHY